MPETANPTPVVSFGPVLSLSCRWNIACKVFTMYICRTGTRAWRRFFLYTLAPGDGGVEKTGAGEKSEELSPRGDARGSENKQRDRGFREATRQRTKEQALEWLRRLDLENLTRVKITRAAMFLSHPPTYGYPALLTTLILTQHTFQVK
jgi:hypothetical protein